MSIISLLLDSAIVVKRFGIQTQRFNEGEHSKCIAEVFYLYKVAKVLLLLKSSQWNLEVSDEWCVHEMKIWMIRVRSVSTFQRLQNFGHCWNYRPTDHKDKRPPTHILTWRNGSTDSSSSSRQVLVILANIGSSTVANSSKIFTALNNDVNCGW